MIDHLQPPPKKWHESSILIKLTVITLIILALLIPSSWIQGLIDERQDNQAHMMSKVSNQWSAGQSVQGPVLVIPYKKLVTLKSATDSTAADREVLDNIYILPQDVHFNANLKTEPYDKGVFRVTVYNAQIGVKGSFAQPDLAKLGINPTQVMFDKARLVFSISDLKGLKTNPVVKVQGKDYAPEPTSGDAEIFEQSLQVSFPLQPTGGFAFSYNLDLNGSNEINFLNIGKTTDVEVNSDWKTPLYIGRHLPDTRRADSNGTGAKWRMLAYNRPFPQQWLGSTNVLNSQKALDEASFGVRLQTPIDDYRKVMRTNKYSTLVILLTFVSLFLTELIRKQNIHLFNYTLIGAAMIVFYLLLLSFSEQIGFNYAYLLSSSATIILISSFTASLLANRGAAALFAFILSIFYGFIFIIIQLEEYSLLVGAVALFFIVAALMYFSRKINWDNH